MYTQYIHVHVHVHNNIYTCICNIQYMYLVPLVFGRFPHIHVCVCIIPVWYLIEPGMYTKSAAAAAVLCKCSVANRLSHNMYARALCAGVADVVSVGCVYIGHSSPQEISRLTSSSASTPYGLQVDPLMSNITYELYTEQLEECNVVFDTVNPHTPSYKTVVIRNYRSAAVIYNAC